MAAEDSSAVDTNIVVADANIAAVDTNITAVASATGGLCRLAYRGYCCPGLLRHDLCHICVLCVPRLAPLVASGLETSG